MLKAKYCTCLWGCVLPATQAVMEIVEMKNYKIAL